MTADTVHSALDFAAGYRPLDVGHRLHQALQYCFYILIGAAYIFVFGLAVLTLGLIEIRQSDLTTFNALIATLDQRDWYGNDYFDKLLSSISSSRANYQKWADSLTCSDASLGPQSANEPTLPAAGKTELCPLLDLHR